MILAACALLVWPHEASAARLIRASISLNGKIILEGSTSDDGHTDADGVWEYLKSIKFKPTDEFQALKVDPAAKQAVLSGAGRGVPLSDSKVTVSIEYGGKSKFRKLTLIRVAKDAQGREWTLDPPELDAMFGYRLISRREASKLGAPGKVRTWGIAAMTLLGTIACLVSACLASRWLKRAS